LPGAYQKLSQLTGMSGANPEAVASAAAKRKDSALVQASLGQLIQAGVSGDWLARELPVLGMAEYRELETMYANFVMAERRAGDAVAARIDAPQKTLNTYKALQIEMICKRLGVSSNELADLLAAFRTLTTADIADYQGGMRSMKRTPV